MREEVVVEIAEALESVLSTPLGGILGGEIPATNDTSDDEPPLRAVYTSVAEEFDVKATDESYNNFREAIAEITAAKKAACKGDGSVSDEDIPRLAKEYNELKQDIEENINEVRDIFGKILCLSERSTHEDKKRKRRQFLCPNFGDPCPCPEDGPIICVCEYFSCLDPDDDIRPVLGIGDVFFEDLVFPCLAFAVDTTGSMRREIETVKEVIRAFLASEEDGPACYVLQPFNDFQDGRFHPASRCL